MLNNCRSLQDVSVKLNITVVAMDGYKYLGKADEFDLPLANDQRSQEESNRPRYIPTVYPGVRSCRYAALQITSRG